MAEKRLSTAHSNNDDDNHSNKDSRKCNSNLLVLKTSEENTKRHKSSFFTSIRKMFSFQKKVKPKELPINNDNNNTPIKDNDSLKSTPKNDFKTDKGNSNDSNKPENRSIVIRQSFGKGKTKEKSSNKELGNIDVTKNRESLYQSESRQQSLHIAYSHPPRNGLLASFGWYWGPLSRSDATHRLRHQDDGSFLVRDSEGDPNKFTLSFKGAGQIFHNRILQHLNKYAFLPDEEFDSIPDLIVDAMRRSATSAYCFSRSTDAAPANSSTCATESHNPSDGTIGAGNDTCAVGSIGTLHKHEVRLLKPISRFVDRPKSLKYLCRFMIRQFTRYQDLCKLIVSQEIILYLEDSKYNV